MDRPHIPDRLKYFVHGQFNPLISGQKRVFDGYQKHDNTLSSQCAQGLIKCIEAQPSSCKPIRMSEKGMRSPINIPDPAMQLLIHSILD